MRISAASFGLLDRCAAVFMRTLRRHGWLFFVVFLVVPVTGMLVGRTLGRPFGLLAAFVAFASPLLGAYFLSRVSRLGERYQIAFDDGDADTMATLRGMFHGEGPMPPEEEMGRRVGEAEELLVREKWAEARDVLGTVDRELVPPQTRPGILANLAYATARAGDPLRAKALAREALGLADEMEDYPADRIVHLRGTLGIVQTLAEDHELAVRTLDPILGAPGAPRAVAARAYHLAKSLDALGRYDEAVKALTIAARERGPFADHARELLQSLPADEPSEA